MNNQNLEGFGLYGWDITSPFLQGMYKKDEEEPDNLVEKQPSPKIELPKSPSILENLTPVAPIDSSHELDPRRFHLQKPQPPTPPKRKVKSFFGGIELSKDRFLNDMRYAKGYLQDKLSVDKSERSKEALEHLPEYNQSTDLELEAKRDSLEKVVEREPSDSSINELKGLKEYQSLRKRGLSQQQIENKLSDLAQWGTTGRKRMEDALNINNNLPEAEGAAILGGLVGDIGFNTLPAIVGAASLPAGVTLGVGTVLSSVAESHSQAQMELDNYERATGKSIPESERLGFTAICVSSDFIFNSILQNRFLGNMKSAVKKQASKYFKNEVLKNLSAQKEIKRMINRLGISDKSAFIKSITDDATLGMATETLNSLSHDISTLIYRNPEDYPTLNEILNNATSSLLIGAASGGLAGSVGAAVNRNKQVTRRQNEDRTAIMNTRMGTVEVIDYNPETKIAVTINPDGKGTTQWKYVYPDEIKVVSFKDYQEDSRNWQLIDEPDPLRRIDPDPHKEEAWKGMSTLGKQRMTLDLAERIGVNNIVVYHHIADLPPSAFERDTPYEAPAGSYYLRNGRVAVVLDEVTSYNDLHHLLLYEAIVQQGLVSFFGGHHFLMRRFMFDLYETMPTESKIHGNSDEAKLLDAGNYLTDIAASGVTTSPMKRIIANLREPISFFNPGLKLTDNDIKNMIINAQNELRNESSRASVWWREMQRYPMPFPEKDRPIFSIDQSTFRFLQENNPDWKGYKRFYDEVYGNEDKPDVNPPNLPEQE